MQDNRGRNVAFRNRSGLETMLERVSDRVIQEVIRYLEDFAESELADAISDRLDEMSDRLVEHCMERLEERLNVMEERMLERMTNDIEQRLIGPRNDTRQGRYGPGRRRKDVIINEEAENHQNLDDEDDRSGEEEPLYMRFLRGDDDEVNDGLNQAENP